jgi:hypothetical protein
MNRGIDYSLGQSNFNPETGIHFGVIPMNSLAHWAWDEFEPDFGEPHCPKCGNPACDSDSDGVPAFDDQENEDIEIDGCGDYYCDSCRFAFDGDWAFSDEALGHTLDGEYKATVDTYNDAFLLDSPYYTKSQFCSPCAPGAGYLLNYCEDGVKSYCFGPDWFDEEQPCPYPVWKCGTDELIYTPPADVD